MKNALLRIALIGAVALTMAGCKKSESVPLEVKPDTATKAAPDTHVHADGSTHADHAPEPAEAKAHGHEHDEVSLGSATIGEMTVEFAQGHGKVEAGKEGHLVVKLPHNDKGATTVRAWIGTEDRLKSVVGKGTYAPSHDDYDIHAVAPDPLPENVMWWVEIQKPDGEKVVGSVKALVG